MATKNSNIQKSKQVKMKAHFTEKRKAELKEQEFTGPNSLAVMCAIKSFISINNYVLRRFISIN
ncbi:MAG: hypothetical protein GY861_24275 [bacterium]|nr:hypothetical protein [bacterium]